MAKKKEPAKNAAKPKVVKKASPPKKKVSDKIPTPRELRRDIDTLKRQNARLQAQFDTVTKTSRAQAKKIASLEGKMSTRVKREEIFMAALEMNPRTKKGDKGAVGELNKSIQISDEHLLKLGTRVENILSALKNHREYLIRLNKKVYKVDPGKKIEMELAIMNNTLSIMALSGFDINKGIFGDMRKVTQMLGKEDADLAKVQKRMASVKKKFEEEMQRFDFDSIFRKAQHIPGYR